MSGINDVINAVVSLVVNPAMGPNTDFGGKVLNYRPRIPGNANPPVAFVYSTDLNETRSGFGGLNGGKKWVDHTVHVDVHFSSLTPETDEVLFRTILDAIRAKMHSNQSLGGLVQRFGEEILVTIDEPFGDGGAVNYHAVITSTAREEITLNP